MTKLAYFGAFIWVAVSYTWMYYDITTNFLG